MTTNRELAARFHCCRYIPSARSALRLCYLKPGHTGACLPIPDRTLQLVSA